MVFRLLSAIQSAEVIRYKKGPDWPELGLSLLIATALVVAICTAWWAVNAPGAVMLDVDPALDTEIDFGVQFLTVAAKTARTEGLRTLVQDG
jgi:hypothetical protein